VNDITLELTAFIRAVGVNRESPHAFFLGAGASISSGVPSAESCVWEWKRDIFLTNNPGMEDQFSEISLPSVKQRIQCWLDAQGRYPELGSPAEYSLYIEHCYPISEDRRTYFQEKVGLARPHIGYKLLCLLAESGIVPSVWTTNFDGLVARAASDFNLAPVEVGIDCQERLPRQPRKGELLCVALHGDYRYDSLKNMPSETQQQEAKLRNALVDQMQDTSLIVCGYSGRDRSVMQALTDVYSKDGTGVLYWCGYGDQISPSARALIEAARTQGRAAYFVPAQGFDDLMIRLSFQCLEGDQLSKARSIVAEAASDLKRQRKRFLLQSLPTVGLIKSNMFEVECPSETFQFDLKRWPQEGVWRWLRSITAGHRIIAVPFRQVLCFGLLDEIKEVFGDKMAGRVERSPIGDRDLGFEEGPVMSLMRQTLVNSMAELSDLDTNGRQLWEKKPYRTEQESVYDCRVHRSVIVFLRTIGGRTFAILKPSLRIEDESEQDLPMEVVNKVKNSILGWQHNRQFNQAIDQWRRKLLKTKPQTTFEYPPDCGSTFRFRIRSAPVFAGIGSSTGKGSVSIPNQMRPLVRQQGILLSEPKLVFSNKQGTARVRDPHPLRGLAENRPFDFPLTQSGLAPTISIGVVCPAAESQQLETYLHTSHSSHQPEPTEVDYLISYPGFESAFGLPLELPSRGSKKWIVCPEPDRGLDRRKGSLELARLITQAIEALNAACRPHVTVVFVPSRWDSWTGFESTDEAFDLHDFIKAYCVQKGIATQLLRQETLTDHYQCRVWWWLAVALYAKAMRTPWVLDALDPETAFVGLGFTVDTKAGRGEHIVLGCSHLYNAQGEGLQFRLSKIENPTIGRRGNPFMSHEDARRVGETIRELFYATHMRLPHRVVIHKLTPFRKDEREGLQEGLSGVAEVDMLEINVDSALRYVASVPKPGGGFDEDNFPVRRGTTVLLDDYTALLWVHGATDSVKRGRRYYKGKRRIPAPSIVRRYAGKTDLGTVAREILGLSKMDWNSADMYSRLPVTIYSSRQIARIGALLQRFGPVSYDYRLFF